MADNSDTKILAGLITIAIMAPVVFIFALYVAWAWAIVASFAFDWFMHPMFQSLPTPTLAQLVGFSTFVLIIGPKIGAATKTDNKLWYAGFLMPWIILLATWCLHFVYVPEVYWK